MTSSNSEGKSHFDTLDGLRGIAALAVVILHWFEGLGYRWFGSSWLAVDFFFMLSGFVVAYSYEERLKHGYPFKKFMVMRLIRLYPMIILGALLGFLRFEGKYLIDHHQLSLDVAFKLITTLFMVPESVLFENDSFELFTINIAFWSLFFEFIAYLLFGLVLYRLKNLTLLFVTVIAFIGVCFWFKGSFGYDHLIERNIAIDGLFKVVFSFCIGIMIYRNLGAIRKHGQKISIYALLLLPALFLLPRNFLPWYFYPLLMLCILPLSMVVGINSNFEGKTEHITSFLGDISYPLYAIHVPLIWVIGFTIKKITGTDNHSYILWFGFITIPITILLAYLALKVYDEPMRKWLKKSIL